MHNETPLSLQPSELANITYLPNNKAVITTTDQSSSSYDSNNSYFSQRKSEISICTLPRPFVPMKSKNANPLKCLENVVQSVKEQVGNTLNINEMNVFTARQVLLEQVVNCMREKMSSELVGVTDNSVIDNKNNFKDNISNVITNSKNITQTTNTEQLCNVNVITSNVHSNANEIKDINNNNNDNAEFKISKETHRKKEVQARVERTERKTLTETKVISDRKRQRKNISLCKSPCYVKQTGNIPSERRHQEVTVEAETNALHTSEAEKREKVRPYSASITVAAAAATDVLLPHCELASSSTNLTSSFPSSFTPSSAYSELLSLNKSVKSQTKHTASLQNIVNISSAELSEEVSSTTSSPTSETSILSTHSFSDITKTHPFTRFIMEDDLTIS